MFYITLFSEYFKNYMKTRLTYRSDFWIEVVSDLAFNFMNLFFILVVYMHTDVLDGWVRAEVIFIYGYFMVPYSIFACFCNLWAFGDRYIVKGEMDRVLTRPAHNLVQIMLENMDPPAIFGAIAGFAVMVYAWTDLDVALSWYDPLVFVLLVIGSVMIYFGLNVIITTFSLFSDSPLNILPLIWNIQNYGRYPISIYNGIIRIMLTWILPFAFVGFYPAAYFLRRETFMTMALLTPVVGLILTCLSLWIWNLGVRRYRGAGS